MLVLQLLCTLLSCSLYEAEPKVGAGLKVNRNLETK